MADELQKHVECRSLSAIGLPGYLASSDGRIFSTFAKGARDGRTAPAHALVGGVASHGYRTVYVKHADGRYRTRCVHELVALAFLGTPPPWHEEYRHLDNDKLNCAVGNLAFGSRKHNAADRVRAGTWMNGPLANTKVTAAIAEDIRNRLATGATGQEIARTLAISEASVSAVKNNRRRWAMEGLCQQK